MLEGLCLGFIIGKLGANYKNDHVYVMLMWRIMIHVIWDIKIILNCLIGDCNCALHCKLNLFISWFVSRYYISLMDVAEFNIY